MKSSLILLTVLLLAPLAALHATETDNPNIIVILTDDHGWADLGAQGVDTNIRTPNVDQLARDGVRFSRGYVTAPQCTPSRAALMSGRYQTKFGVEENFDPMPSSVVTLPERLKTSGYVTGISGKWHLATIKDASGTKTEDPALAPRHQGFDEYFVGTALEYSASHGLDGIPYPDAPRVVTEAGCRVVLQTEWALKFLERRAAEAQNQEPGTTNAPFFLYISYGAPHTPLEFPKPWIDQVPTGLSSQRRSALALLAAIDDGVGRVRQQINAMGQAENTLIFFLGDNGAPLGSSGDGSINLPMRGQKGMVAEGGVRVPFVAAWPGKIPGNQVFQHPVISLDIAATAIASAGQPTAPELDGVNLLPYVTGENNAPPHQTLYWRWVDQAAIQEFPYKLILLGKSKMLLFDITTPEGEHHTLELSAQHPEIVTSLRAKLDIWLDTLSPPGLPRTLQREGAFISSGLLPAPIVVMPSLYWDSTDSSNNGAGTYWATLGNWDTLGTGGVDPLTVPGSSDIAFFNASGNNGDRTVTIYANTTIGGMVFTNTGVTKISSQNGGTTGYRKTLTIGVGGVTVNSGSGAVTFGTGSRPMSVSLGSDQTWVNNSAALLSMIAGGSDRQFEVLSLYEYRLTVDGTGNTTLGPNTLNGSAQTAVVKNGTGTLTFNSTNATFMGDVEINGGIVRYGVASALPSGADVIFNSESGTANLDLNNFSGTLASLTFDGDIDTTAAITTGTGTLTLGGNVIYNAVNDPNGATINGKLDLGAATRTFTVGNSTAAVDDLTVSAAISGSAAGLVKEGAGTLTLSGANSYSGATAINAGTLVVNGSHVAAGAGAYTVLTNATLGGSGIIGSAVTVNNGGTLAPGGTNAAARLTCNANVTLAANARFHVNINGPAVETQVDQLAMAGNTLTISGATLDVKVGPGYAPRSGTAFEIASGFATLTGTFAGLPEGAEFQPPGAPVSFYVHYDTASSPQKIWLRTRNLKDGTVIHVL